VIGENKCSTERMDLLSIIPSIDLVKPYSIEDETSTKAAILIQSLSSAFVSYTSSTTCKASSIQSSKAKGTSDSTSSSVINNQSLKSHVKSEGKEALQAPSDAQHIIQRRNTTFYLEVL
jgi:hypothetical protein